MSRWGGSEVLGLAAVAPVDLLVVMRWPSASLGSGKFVSAKIHGFASSSLAYSRRSNDVVGCETTRMSRCCSSSNSAWSQLATSRDMATEPFE